MDGTPSTKCNATHIRRHYPMVPLHRGLPSRSDEHINRVILRQATMDTNHPKNHSLPPHSILVPPRHRKSLHGTNLTPLFTSIFDILSPSALSVSSAGLLSSPHLSLISHHSSFLPLPPSFFKIISKIYLSTDVLYYRNR
jgi:hypothetical protein